jgi:hypothetical protein
MDISIRKAFRLRQKRDSMLTKGLNILLRHNVEVTGGGSSEAAVNVVLAKEEKLESKGGRHLQQAYRRKLFAVSVA